MPIGVHFAVYTVYYQVVHWCHQGWFLLCRPTSLNPLPLPNPPKCSQCQIYSNSYISKYIYLIGQIFRSCDENELKAFRISRLA